MPESTSDAKAGPVLSIGGRESRADGLKALRQGGSMGTGANRKGGEAGNEGGDLPRPMEGVHDALERACWIQEKAASVGFDWGEVTGPLAKLHEELAEVEGAIAGGDMNEVVEEIGDLLFSVVNLSRIAGVSPTQALGSAISKFQRRFEGVRHLARERGLSIPGASLEEMDLLWDEVKQGERGLG